MTKHELDDVLSTPRAETTAALGAATSSVPTDDGLSIRERSSFDQR